MHRPAAFFRFLMLLLASAWLNAASAETAVVVLLSGTGPAYSELTDALRSELELDGIAPLEVQAGNDSASLARTAARLYVAVGAAAFQAAMDSDARAPILATLLPRSAYERIVEKSGRRNGRQISAVYLDQPLSRQFNLIHLALPDKRNVGVLVGPESAALAPALARAGEERGWHVLTSRADTAEAIFPALQSLVGDVDVLLAEPDPTIYNGNTIQNILLTTYRAQIPLIGFSPAYVKAGALLALYSTPAQLGRQSGEIARSALAGRALPGAQAPRDFTISENSHVARSLDVRIEDTERLSERLRQLERRP